MPTSNDKIPLIWLITYQKIDNDFRSSQKTKKGTSTMKQLISHPKAHELIALVLLTCSFFLQAPKLALADHRAESDFFEPKTIFGDGSKGRVFRQWKQQIPERPVEEVSMVVTRRTGEDDTYLNLRFGRGETFDNQKRISIRDNQPQTIRWEVGGKLPNGEPLWLNVYNGEVYVESVIVRYRNAAAPAQPPSPPAPPRPQSPTYQGDHGYDDHGYRPRGDHDDHYSANDADAVERCRRVRTRTPRIEIGRIRSSGNLFSDQYKVQGSISGACIQEAGYYEYGRLKQRIEIPLSDRFQRQKFETKIRSGKNGEIRAYTVDGAEDSVSVDDEISRNQGDSLF